MILHVEVSVTRCEREGRAVDDEALAAVEERFRDELRDEVAELLSHFTVEAEDADGASYALECDGGDPWHAPEPSAPWPEGDALTAAKAAVADMVSTVRASVEYAIDSHEDSEVRADLRDLLEAHDRWREASEAAIRSCLTSR